MKNQSSSESPWFVWRPGRGKQLAFGETAQSAAESILPKYTGRVMVQSLESTKTLEPSLGMGPVTVYLRSGVSPRT